MNAKVLLVDDDAAIREILTLSIEDLGYAVTAVPDGKTALALFGDFAPDIVLTDIKMPGMDGIELLKRVKALDQEVEVIMISGHGDMELAIASLQQQALDFITKPIRDELLVSALARAVERRTMRRQIREHTQNLERIVKEKSARLVALERQIAVGQVVEGLSDAMHDLVGAFDQGPSYFNELPCFITIHNRYLEIVAANALCRQRLAEVNRPFRSDFGEAAAGLCHELFSHSDEPCPHCPAQATFQDGLSHQFETVVTARDGSQRNVLVQTAPLTDPSGAIDRVLEIATDITTIRQLQDHLASLGLMLGSMSHGVKGLLTSLDGGIYKVDTGLARDDPAKVRQGWTVVSDKLGRIRKMVLDILYYAKSREPDFAPVDVATFAGDLAAIVAPKAKARGVDFALVIEGEAGKMAMDEPALTSAMVNFLDNAVDACAEDTAKSAHSLVFSVRGDEAGLTFAIRDNGLGMDRDTREKMFTLFFSSKGSRGTGLGLFISHQIVTRHGGAIRVDSEPGQGTDVTVVVPRRQPD